MDRLLTVALIIVIILGFVYTIANVEHFDTYYNHSMGAQDIYSKSDQLDEIEAAAHLKETETLANYTWSARAPNGMQLYDYYYETALHNNGSNVKSDPTYYKRDLEADYLDTKFSIPPQDDLGSSSYNLSTPDPLYTIFNGEYITLSQKTY